jgi:hypothetical protein
MWQRLVLELTAEDLEGKVVAEADQDGAVKAVINFIFGFLAFPCPPYDRDTDRPFFYFLGNEELDFP